MDSYKVRVGLAFSMPVWVMVIVAMVALAIATIMAWTPHSEAKFFFAEPFIIEDGTLIWAQPQEVTERYPEPIVQNDWHFDYGPVEQTLLTAKVDRVGELLLNADTTHMLERAVANLPLGMDDDELQRVAFLAAKGMPGPAGQKLASVLTDFYYYQQAVSVFEASSEPSNDLADAMASHQQTIGLKEHYLGKSVVNALFGQQHALASYVLTRRQINENSNLTTPQKKRQLLALRSQFQQTRQQ